MDSATGRAAYPGDGPSLAGRLAAQNRPDRPAFRVAEDKSIVGLVGFGRPDFDDIVARDFAVLRLKLQDWY